MNNIKIEGRKKWPIKLYLPIVLILGHITAYSANCNIIFVRHFQGGREAIGTPVINNHHTRSPLQNLPCCVLVKQDEVDSRIQSIYLECQTNCTHHDAKGFTQLWCWIKQLNDYSALHKGVGNTTLDFAVGREDTTEVLWLYRCPLRR